MSRKSLAIAFFAPVALALLVTSTAWACFPFPMVTVAPHASGPSGHEVTVKGVDLGEGTVEVRWNAMDGLLMATASGPNFNLPVRIPEAVDGLYTLVVLTRGPDDGVRVKAAAQFEVVSPQGRPTNGGTTVTERSSPGPGIVALSLGGVGLVVVGALVGSQLRSKKAHSRDRPSERLVAHRTFIPIG